MSTWREELEPRGLEAVVAHLGRALLAPAPHEWLLVLFNAYLWARVWIAPRGAERSQLLLVTGGSLALLLALLVAGHHQGERRGWRRSLLRVTPIAAIALPYAFMGRIIALANPALHDLAIYRLDLALFGVEPAVWAEPLLTRPLVELLSAAYMSYWVVGVGLVLWAMLSTDSARSARFAVSLVLTIFLGQVLYIAVPGFGPHRALAHVFAGPLPGGPLYRVMLQVCAAGAQRDIFPSLHTGHMVFFTLWLALEGRDSRVHRTLAWPMGLLALLVVAATMALRWHYLLDVLAGAALAVACTALGRRIVARAGQRREEAGLSPVLW